MRVKEIMYPFPKIFGTSATVREVHKTLSDRGVHYALIVRDGDVLGLACACDLKHAKMSDSVALHMHSPLVAIDMNDTAVLAAHLISLSGSGCLIVLDSHARLRGIITRADLQETGLLPRVLGVDLCIDCGSNEHLIRVGSERLTQCCECLSKASEELEPRVHMSA